MQKRKTSKYPRYLCGAIGAFVGQNTMFTHIVALAPDEFPLAVGTKGNLWLRRVSNINMF
jgi:hypothetical protein